MFPQSVLDATPLIIGVWVGALSMVLILGLVADVVEGFHRNELWFPCRFVSIDGVYILLMIQCSSAMAIPDDITSELTGYNLNLAKFVYIMFVFTMLANYLPSLGFMNNEELIDSMKCLGLFFFWIGSLLLDQTCSQASDIPSFVVIFIINILLWPFLVALAVPAFRRKQLRRLPSNVIMEETEHLQFMIASSPFFSACGVICTFFALYTLATLYSFGFRPIFSVKVIILVQSSGIVLGGITLMFRCFNATILSERCTLNQLLHVFKVEKHWTEIVREQKHHFVYSRVLAQPYRNKKIFRVVKHMIMNLYIGHLLTTLVICQITSLVPICLVICYLAVAGACTRVITWSATTRLPELSDDCS
uniref:uncharacterized protein LOC122597630 n=1 Tax=Erigeron canadensis TaxID=72917 RepID=UPI001CB8F8F5|nr:uncharacterized protein LOC122597630 [Erigeron canadensis]